MFDFLNKFRIPTILGLILIIFGTTAGVTLVLVGNQSLTTKASPNQTPHDITFSNATSTAISVSWQTTSTVASFLTFGQKTADEQTVLDDRDINKPTPRNIHYVTVKNLTPQTTYQVKILAGKLSYPQTLTFTTATATNGQNDYKPLAGTVLENNQPVQEGVAYLSITGAYLQSALVKNIGSFIIPINNAQNKDLSGIFIPPTNTTAKLTVLSVDGKGSALFQLTNTDQPLTKLTIGQDLDLTNQQPTPTPTILNIYDLNGDGKVNADDYAILVKHQTNHPTVQESQQYNFNNDKVIDKKDLDLLSAHIFKNAKPSP